MDRTPSSETGRTASGVQPVLLNASFGLGGACLFVALTVDFLGVLARHLGIQALGLIEIIQLCIVGAISSALVVATATGSHAAVHLLTTRVSPKFRRGLARVSDGFSACLFLVLAFGGAWILEELLPKHEQGDLLHLPIAPARALWSASLLIAAALEGAAALKPAGDAQAAAGTVVYEP